MVTGPNALFTATQDNAGIALTRIDPATRTTAATRHLDLASPFTLDGLASDGTRLWVVVAGTAYDLDTTTLTVTRTIGIDDQGRGAVKGAAIANDALWLLTDNGATLSRVDTRTGQVGTAMKILPETPRSFRIPASLITNGTRVWAMVQKNADPNDRSVRVVGYHPARKTPTQAVDLPSALFAGAAAVT